MGIDAGIRGRGDGCDEAIGKGQGDKFEGVDVCRRGMEDREGDGLCLFRDANSGGGGCGGEGEVIWGSWIYDGRDRIP